MSQGSDFSWFASVEQLHPREIFALESQFKEDDCDHKINLGNGHYQLIVHIKHIPYSVSLLPGRVRNAMDVV